MNLNNMKQVYTHLQDDKSKLIFEKRALWSLSGDARYIFEMLDAIRDRDGMDRMVEQMRTVSDHLVVRGAGNEYRTFKRWYPDFTFACFVDKDPVKQEKEMLDGHKVISVEEYYENYRDYYVMINSSAYNAEILSELKANSSLDEKIFNFGDFHQEICDAQYFEQGIMAPVAHEVFIDGGTYDGMTSRRFATWCGGNYDRILAFEPDGNNYQRLLKMLEQDPLPNMKVWNRGLWNGSTVLRFAEKGTQGSGISDQEDAVEIHTISIDEALEGKRATLIKLDVEGAEYETLFGAKDTITKYHPRMAISIYHKPEDIFVLPELVLSFSEDYRFYLRHYQMSRFETILYAI